MRIRSRTVPILRVVRDTFRRLGPAEAEHVVDPVELVRADPDVDHDGRRVALERGARLRPVRREVEVVGPVDRFVEHVAPTTRDTRYVRI